MPGVKAPSRLIASAAADDSNRRASKKMARLRNESEAGLVDTRRRAGVRRLAACPMFEALGRSKAEPASRMTFLYFNYSDHIGKDFRSEKRRD